jgi:hypothetical protein
VRPRPPAECSESSFLIKDTLIFNRLDQSFTNSRIICFPFQVSIGTPTIGHGQSGTTGHTRFMTGCEPSRQLEMPPICGSPESGAP